MAAALGSWRCDPHTMTLEAIEVPVQAKLDSIGLQVHPAPSSAGRGFLVTGYTFHFREAIKQHGGRWDPERRAWLVPDAAAIAALAAALPASATVAAPGPGLAEARPQDVPAWGSKHYHGHRDRLRQRFLDTDPEGFADYELLELVLFFTVHRRDTKPIAKELIARFGSLGAVLAADPHRYGEVLGLRSPAGETDPERRLERDDDLRFSTVLLKSIRTMMLRVLKEEIRDRPVLGSWTALMDYLQAAMTHEAAESFRILFLDRKNILLRDEVQSRGTVDHTPLYPREVVKRALELGASAIIMVHNHPSGDPTPSPADLEMTSAVVQAMAAVNLQVHDHVIVGKNRHLSFRTQRLM